MAKTKSNGEGTIYRFRNGWRGQITIEGERTSATGKTKQEVIEKLDAIKSQHLTGFYAKKNEITVKEWGDEWLKKYVEPTKTEGTYLGYKRMFNNHIFSLLGEEKLQNLTKPIIEEAYGKMFQEKIRGKKTTQYAHSTVNSISVQFKKCLQEAVNNDILAKNPHAGVHLHKLRPPQKIEAYSRDDQEKIINYLKTADDLRQIFYVLIATGIRIGEMTALNWSDIDFENRTINITKIVVEIRGNPKIEDRTKTPTGTRKIAVSEKVIEVLKGLHQTQIKELNFGDLVFPSARYTIRTQSNLRSMWIKVCKAADVPYRGLHALRHTWATRALESGVDIKTVSVMLGHKNVVTTMNVYQDVLHDYQLDNIEKMDCFL